MNSKVDDETKEPSGLVGKLVKLSSIDASLARIIAERKTLSAKIEALNSRLKKTQQELSLKEKLLGEKQHVYQKEEKQIKEERDRLIARRRALGTLSGQKVQQAAERELDTASKHISTREESLILTLELMEGIEKEVDQLKVSLQESSTEHASITAESDLAFANLDSREKELKTKRSEILPAIDASSLSLYERMQERFPCDPIVPVTNDCCPACFIQVVPQLKLQIASGQSLVKCRGCGRILYIAAQAS